MASTSRNSRVINQPLQEGDVRVRVGALGISALGTQVAGTVEAVGPDSAGFARNDRVAFRSIASTSSTSSATVVVTERELMGIPADVSLDSAAAIFPCALLARTVVKQVHSIGRGTRVAVTDVSVIAPFVTAWVEHLGGTVVAGGETGRAELVISGQSIQWLALSGFDTETYSSAEDALKVIGPDFQGVVVSDIKMPGMDGMAFLKRLMGQDSGLPVILITGHGDVPMAVEAMRVGAFDSIALSSVAEARNGSRSPVLLHPAEVTLAA